MLEILIVFNVLLLALNAALFHGLSKYDTKMEEFVTASDRYVDAFREVKDATNQNAALYASWGKEVIKQGEYLEKVNNILEIHSYALKLSPPAFLERKEKDEATVA